MIKSYTQKNVQKIEPYIEPKQILMYNKYNMYIVYYYYIVKYKEKRGELSKIEKSLNLDLCLKYQIIQRKNIII